ncbi:hypothetical protein vseg_016481 [Gypsophila vaccaria]
MAISPTLVTYFTPSSKLEYNPLTINHPNPIIHKNKPYSLGLPQFSILFSSEFKFRRNIPLIINASKHEHDTEAQEEEFSVGVKAALLVLNFYKGEISPLLPKSCRYVPTCSEYSMIAYKKYGFAKGTALTACRICRCNPLGGSGFDPPRWFGEERPLEDGD